MESEDGLGLALVDDLEIAGVQVGDGLAGGVERHWIEVHKDGRAGTLCQKPGCGHRQGAKQSLGFRHMDTTV
jgi:hypothetical protein